jgi:type IV secretory pathway TrbD component
VSKLARTGTWPGILLASGMLVLCLVLGLALGVAASVGVAVYFIIAGRATHGARRPPMQR